MAFIRKFIKDHGYPPSHREIQEGLGLSSVCLVHYRLKKLASLGLIERVPGRARALRLKEA